MSMNKDEAAINLLQQFIHEMLHRKPYRRSKLYRLAAEADHLLNREAREAAAYERRMKLGTSRGR